MSHDFLLPPLKPSDTAKKVKAWRLDSQAQTLLLMSTGGVAECIYWGSRLSDEENLASFYCNQQRPISGSTLDTPIPLSLCPEESQGFIGHPGVEISTLNGQRIFTAFKIKDVIESTDSLIFILTDDTLGLQLKQSITLNSNSEIIEAHSEIEILKTQQESVRVDWLCAPVLPVPDSARFIQDFAGRWCGEFQPQITEWKLGSHTRESREGRTSHSHIPLMLSGHSLKNTSGDVYAWHFAWAGGHRMIAEEVTDGRRQVQFGVINNTQILSVNNPRLKTPVLCMSYSEQGMNGALQAFHRYARQSIIKFADPKRPRPVHYNCWEAIYFDHEIETLKIIATGAANIGAERFVLDDGWFKNRNHDRAALGDWTVDNKKYPEGLHPLIEHIHSEGMTFGLWVEPEMVNADSDLYRKHPEWVLGPSNHIEGRQQLVLDLSQDAVVEYLFTVLNSVLEEYPIEYLKWDHNRVCLGSSSQQTLALYDLLKRLRQAHPQLEIESCASGGGRIDYGILAHTQRVWLSDSNDALERWRIQHEAALLLPPEITGSHVGPRVCHTSGRILPMAFRAWVAASRHMGLEMDVRELSADELVILSRVITWWKQNRHWLFEGKLSRLEVDDLSIMAEMTVDKTDEKFVVFAAQMQTSERQSSRLLRLTGLEPNSVYRLKLHDTVEIPPNITRYWASTIQSDAGLTLTGKSLMKHGISLPVALPASMIVIEGEKIN